MIANSKLITKFLYIQLFNFCIRHKSCSACTYKSDADPCQLFSGVFDELDHCGAKNIFDSICQAYAIHKNYDCGKCVLKDRNRNPNLCRMIAFSEAMFYSSIKNGRVK